MSESSAGGVNRLRIPPQERFAHEEHFFDLNEKVQQLIDEPATSVQGHQQVALYRYGPMTLALFLFREGGTLPDHSAEGVMSMHALSGGFTIHTAERDYELSAGQIVVLAPNVVHDVTAKTEARLLLTVCLNEQA